MANSEEVSNDYIATSTDDFMAKIKQLGYDAELEVSVPYNHRVIISKDEYYCMSIHYSLIIQTPFNYIVKHIKREFEKLKRT